MDAESFKKEFLPYHRKLYCIAYRLLENAADAEDLVQEAYLKLWDKREGLPVQQQKIVTLRDVKGCSYEEIEQVTGLNATNVRVLLSRARKKIREEFNKWSNYESRGN